MVTPLAQSKNLYISYNIFVNSRQMATNFTRNQLPLKKWLEDKVYVREAQPTPDSLAKYICLTLIDQYAPKRSQLSDEGIHTVEVNDEDEMRERDQIEQLWNRNEYFYQCLVDLSQEIMYYVYSYCWRTRASFPRCLLGYYELSKNIVHLGLAGKSEENVIPECLRSFIQEKIIRILFVDSNFSNIKNSLTRMSQSMHTQSFIKQLAQLILLRVNKFKNLFSIKLNKQTNQALVAIFVSELESKDDSHLEMPIDQILLCFCYSIYKLNKERILFSKMINIYEGEFQTSVDKQELLKFYNEVYIMQKIPTVLPKQAKIDRCGGAEKLLGDAIKEEQSILGLFE